MNQKSLGYSLIVLSAVLLIVLTLVKINVDEQGAFLCELAAENPGIRMEDCPAHRSNTSWYILLSFGLAVLILAGGLYMIYTPIKQEKKANTSKLNDEEKKIYELIKEKEGSVYQSDLIKMTGLSKVKITRILDKMEGKGVIDRKRRGMTNIIILK